MKKIVFILAIVLLITLCWWNRYFLIHSVHAFLRRPQKLPLSSVKSERIKIEYVKSNYLSTSKIKSIQKSLWDNLDSAEKKTGIQLDSVLTVHLFNSYEEIGNYTHHVPIAQIDEKTNQLYYVVNENVDGTTDRLEYALLFRQKYGPPSNRNWERYLAAALAGSWQQKTLEEWSKFLIARDLEPEFPQFLTTKETYSPFLIYPWNAIFAKFVMEKFDHDALVALYKKGTPPQNFHNEWETYRKRLPQSEPLPPYRFQPEFQKGVCYACANSYDSGYGTDKSEKSLDLLKKNGVEWIASIPYGFSREPNSTRIRFAGDSIFSESDESVFALREDARSRGIKVMLKPQIWLSHSSWPGNIQFENDHSWDLWFRSYENWIVHYAIIAELTQTDLFCIGTELVETTLKKPDHWKSMIARIRKIYHGPLVYASNWGKEFEQITFWKELDYMGLDNYYPVRKYSTENIASVRIAFQEQKKKVADIVHRNQKPLLFTEIGFTASDGSGMGSSENDYPGYNEKVQEECYRLAFETYWNEPWFCGLYWWKWFSDPEDSGHKADAHSPAGRLAEKVLHEWYHKEKVCETNHIIQ